MDGALKSEPDDRDWIYEHLVKGRSMDQRGRVCTVWQPLPERYVIDQPLLPPRDQEHAGTCAAFTGAAICEVLLSKDEHLSPEFIYYHRANKPHGGMFGRDVFHVLRRIGTVPETMYPYAQGGSDVPPDGKLYKVAEQHRIEKYARVTTIEGLKRALIELGPCYLGLPQYNHTERFWDKSAGYTVSGGHSVMVFGYDSVGFLFLNSWGESWGDGGYGLLPYEDFGLVWEIWTAIV
jgi:hypothetical protein